MPHHVIAWTAVIGNGANTEVAALNDDIIVLSVSNRFMLPTDFWMLLAFASSATLLRARINSPTLRQVSPPQIRPIEVSLLPTDLPSIASWLDQPFRLLKDEQLILEATSGVAMTERFTALAWLAPEVPGPVPSGDVITLRFTSATAAVANVWTTLTITLEQDLPPGRYAMVGSEMQSTNAIAHRWIIPNQLWRPGNVSITALANAGSDLFYRRRLGEWGQFVNTAMPQPQVLCNAADAVHAGFLQIVRVA